MKFTYPAWSTKFSRQLRVPIWSGPNQGLHWSVASTGREYLTGRFESGRVGALLSLVRPDDCAWDVGAHKGYVTLALVPRSNFAGDGPAPVGEYTGMGPFGTFDMAGNAREWGFNAVREDRYMLGGGWTDPDHVGVDVVSLAYYGWSWGGYWGPLPLALEPRFKAAILDVAGLSSFAQPEIDPAFFTPRTSVPVLMLSGRLDAQFALETSARPFFDLLGTPEEQKHHVVSEARHFLPMTSPFLRLLLCKLHVLIHIVRRAREQGPTR